MSSGVRDSASMYLYALQTGYRIDDYSLETDGSGIKRQICPFNPSRVLLFIGPDVGTPQNISLRSPQGIIYPLVSASNESRILTVNLHFLLPSFELVCDNVGMVPVSAFGIVKT